MKKIALIANTSWYIYNFRSNLIKDIVSSNYKLVVIAPHDNYTNLLEKSGYTVINWTLNRSSLNPLSELKSIVDLVLILNKENPDLIHNFTIKSCLYATIASRFSKVRYVINSITGLGHLFLNNSTLIRFIRFILKPIYALVFNTKNSFLIFQNIEDQKYLFEIGIIKNLKKSFLIEGSGVDINFYKPNKDNYSEFRKPIKLLFPSRLIREKGIEEVLIAYNELIKNGEDIKLLIAGEIDEGNRSSLKDKDKKNISSNKNIILLGHRSDLKEIYSTSDIVLLPSWREGLSRSLIEAAAMEKPIITTNVPGCRDIIDHGINGILVPLKDPKAIELAILFLIRNRLTAKVFGKNIREKVKKRFDVKKINSQTLKIYNQTLNR